MSNTKPSTKRSLSESSADEYHNKAALSGGNVLFKQKSWLNELDLNSTGKHPMCIQSSNSYFISNIIDIAIRVVLVIVFIKLETTHSFVRKIHQEELWLYKNPRSSDYVSPRALILSVILGPFFLTLLYLILTGNRRDFRAASWTWTLTLGLNGLVTSLLKILVGRPRPDFYYRCFPDGVMVLNNITGIIDNGTMDLLNCTGNAMDINEGRKSFPSGHSSFAFAGFGFIAFYVAAKLHAFNTRGRGQTWRMCAAIMPLVLATLIAISRTCDYHHHWQDVLVGSLIGLFISYACYRQYYPSLLDAHCNRAYRRYANYKELKLNEYRKVSCDENHVNAHCKNFVSASYTDDLSSENGDVIKPLLNNDKGDNKWI